MRRMRNGSAVRGSLAAAPVPAPLLTVLLTVLLAACGDPAPPASPAPPPSPVPYGTSPYGSAPASPDPDPVDARAVAVARLALESVPEDPMRALLIAREAARIDHTPEVLETLHRALDAVGGDKPFHAHRGSTLAACWTPDGKHVLTTSLDTTARLWTPDGRPIALLEGHQGSIHQAAFHPDGNRIVTASVDHTARIWDMEGKLLETIRVHDAEVVEASWSFDGMNLLTVSLDGTAYLRQVTGATMRIEPERRDVVKAVHRSGGAFVVRRDAGGGFASWGEERVALLGGAVNDVVDVVPAPRGDRLVLLTDGAPVFVVDAAKEKATPLEGHDAQSLDAAFSPDGTRVATASLDATARLWAVDGTALAVMKGHGAAVHEVAFSPSGARLLTVSSDRTARTWDLAGHPELVLGSKADPIAGAAWSPDGRLILTTGYERGPARIYDLEGRLVQVLPDDTGRTLAATWSPDGTRVLTLDRTLTPHLRYVDEAALRHAVDVAIDRYLLPDEQVMVALALNGDVGEAAMRFAAARPAPVPRDRVLRGDYAGTVVCAACHRKAYEGWVKSSHARTSYFAIPEVLPEDVLQERTVEHPPWKTTFRKTKDGWVARTVGEDGKEHDFPLSMVSGHLRVRFFMTRLPDGRIQVLPAMYEIPEKEWFDYSHLIYGGDGDYETPPRIEPGDPSFWTGPVRSWDARCAHCHMSGKTAIERKAGEHGPRSLVRAFAVDCEACHGPARLHAEAWRRLEMDETLTRLERLSRRDHVATCTQCHQEGEVLSPPFAPGQDLYEYIDPTVAVDPERADPAGRPTELIYDGLPFATSACANAGGLVCSDCHAPHGSETRSLLRKPPEDGWLCARCHQEYVDDPVGHSHHAKEGSGSKCALCHMPFLTIERGHGAVADHTIGIPRLGLVADRVQPDACTWCHEQGLHAPKDAPALTEEELWRAYEEWWPGATGWPQPWMAALASARMGEPGAVKGLVALLKDGAAPREARASAAQLLGRFPQEAEEAIFRAAKDPDSLVRRNAIKSLAKITGDRADRRLLDALEDPSWAVRVAAARAALDGWTRVQANRPLLEAIVPVLRADAEKVPDDDLRWFRLGAAYELLKDYENALGAYERKAALDPFANAIRKHVKDLKALLGYDAND